MQTNEIDCIVRKSLSFTGVSRIVNFLGVFSFDEQPLLSYSNKVIASLQYPIAYIFNSDPATKPGTHWLAMYQSSVYSPAEFFDSYAFHPSFYSLHLPNALYSTTKLQSYNTDVCGHYCILFITYRALPLYPSLNSVVRFFQILGEQRDLIIKRLVDALRCISPSRTSNTHYYNHVQCCTRFEH